MDQRLVTGTGKDGSGDVTTLCGPWGTAPKAAAIMDIQFGRHRYFTRHPDGSETEIDVVDGVTGPSLRCRPGGALASDLQSLPDC